MAHELPVLCRKWFNLSWELFHQNYLHVQFSELQSLPGGSGAEHDLMRLYFEDAEKTLDKLRRLLAQHQPDHPVNFESVQTLVEDLKAYSACVGAQRVKVTCLTFLKFIRQADYESCVRLFHQLMQELFILKSKLETLFQLEERIVEIKESL